MASARPAGGRRTAGKARPAGDRPTALITGASAGIGAALAGQFAAHGHDLVLVARRRDLLDALADTLQRRHGVRADVIARDLLEPEAARRLFEETSARRIDVLVNNAGVYEVVPFERMPRDRLQRMVRLNVSSLAELVHHFLPPMLERGRGRILNVASVAGFQAVPLLSLYAATKAFVVSLTEGLAEELKGTGVTVTALCPGVTETEGVRSARDRSDVVARVPRWAVSSEDDVAREGFEACMAGEVVRVPGLVNQAMTMANRYPRSVSRFFGGFVARRYKAR
jgi:hypothetical protein